MVADHAHALAYADDACTPAWLGARFVSETDARPDQIDAFFAPPSHAAPADAQSWFAVPDPAHAAAVAPWLDADERARRDAFQHAGALAQFLTGRWLLRGALAAHLGAPPATIRIALTERGALALPDHPGWHVNLTHTEGLVAVALARTPIGVDVEPATRDARVSLLAQRYFAPSEVAALFALPEAAQRERFVRLWTLKEAYIKARGQGMAIPLQHFAFDLDAAERAFTTSDDLATRAPWRFASWRPTPGHIAAVAAQRA